MAVVPFPKKRRRISIRYYLCTDEGPVRMPLRLYRDLISADVSIPEFAGTIQRMAEVLITTGPGDNREVKVRATATHFNKKGSVDLSHAAEAVAVAIEGAKPRRVGKNVLDIGPTLRSRQLRKETAPRLSRATVEAILADLQGKTRLRTFRLRRLKGWSR